MSASLGASPYWPWNTIFPFSALCRVAGKAGHKAAGGVRTSWIVLEALAKPGNRLEASVCKFSKLATVYTE